MEVMMTTMISFVSCWILVAAGILLVLHLSLSIEGSIDERSSIQSKTARQHLEAPSSLLNMTLYSDKCAGENSKTYLTPVDECYSSSSLFPNDPSWSGKDVLDTIEVPTRALLRTIYDTEDATCGGDGDELSIPLDECVGPFGRPRPWGTFRLVRCRRRFDLDAINSTGRKNNACDGETSPS